MMSNVRWLAEFACQNGQAKVMAKLLPEFFRRTDEQPDPLFYTEPRFSTPLGPAASSAACARYTELLPKGGHVLDLMAGYVSHLPGGLGRVTGLGLNRDELAHNSSLSDYLVLDLNRSSFLPFMDATFGGAVCTEGVPYLTRPLATFAEVGRSLKPGAPFAVAFSNRLVEAKAVLAWRVADSAARVRLVRSYFGATPAFGGTHSGYAEPVEGEPLFMLWAFKRSG